MTAATKGPAGWLQPARAELPDLVRTLHASRTPWRPAGRGEHLHWCRQGRADGTVVSLAGHNRILHHAVDDFTVDVEAGMALPQLQAALASRNQWLAVDPPPGSLPGTIGGLVARGLSGGFRHRYLGIRDQIIGVGFLRADGASAKAGGRVVKNVAGYDLMRLLCGSWGSLALLTRLTLRTYPQPPHRLHLLLAGPVPELLDFRNWLLRSTLTPERVDWWSASMAQGPGFGELPYNHEDVLLAVGFGSIAPEAIAAQQQALEEQLPASIHCRSVAPWPAAVLADPPASRQWMVHFGCRPAELPLLISRSAARTLHWHAAAGTGLGYGIGELDVDAVVALREQLSAHGGFLTVLVQPNHVVPMVAPWQRQPAARVINAVKQTLDPRGLLAPGVLPGA